MILLRQMEESVEGFDRSGEGVAERTRRSRRQSPDGAEPAGPDTPCRRLTALAEFRACERLQRETWGERFSDVVPASLLMVAAKVGGLVAGAFDPDGGLVGFVFGLAGSTDGRPAQWSHMLAVRREARGRGVGRRLKLFQREEALRDGVEQILWSYDPLVARNAHLNFNRLGVEALRYEPNMYGAELGSPLHGALDTDRLIVRWRLDSERTLRALAGAGLTIPAEAADLPIVRPDPGGLAPPPSDRLPDAPAVRVEVPLDIVQLIRREPETAARWRQVTRLAFTTYLDRGYTVRGLYREQETNRCYYVFSRP